MPDANAANEASAGDQSTASASAAAVAVAPSPLLWPTSLVLRWCSRAKGEKDKYRFGELLGKGSFGSVWAADRDGVDKKLAVKLIKEGDGRAGAIWGGSRVAHMAQ